jgi:hypothetical protein
MAMMDSIKTPPAQTCKDEKLTTYNDFVRRFYPSDEKVASRPSEKPAPVETTLGFFYSR